jgi:SAM-dependent methyltransferase
MMAVFPLGQVEVTPEAEAALAAAGARVDAYLDRHTRGDCGEDPETQEWSTFGLQYGHLITSSYPLPTGQHLVVTTGVARATTRVLLDSEWGDREVDVRMGYAQWAPVHDVEKNPLIAIEAPRVAALLAPLPITQALDVGAGTGRHALALAWRGVQVTAFDQSPEMLAQAQHVAAREGLAITFQHGVIEDGLPFPNGAFDLVLCALMLSHVADLPTIVAEFYRVLHAGGHLLITDFHPDVVAAGWRTVLFCPGTTYLLPNPGATRADYLAAVRRRRTVRRPKRLASCAKTRTMRCCLWAHIARSRSPTVA